MKGMSIEQICTALGQHLSRMSRKVNIVFFSIATVLLILMALPATVDVLARYLFSYSVPGTVDITELALAMIIFGVMGYVNDNDSHIRVTLLLEKLPEHVRAVLRYSSSGLSVALFACMTYCMYANGVNKFLGNEGSYSISLPLYIFVFICTAFLIGHVLSLSAQTLLHLADLLRSRRYAGLLAGTALVAAGMAAPFFLQDTVLGGDPAALGITGVSALMVLLFLGMPIGTAMAGIGFLGMLIFYPTPRTALSMLGVSPLSTASSYVYGVVPMFILMGNLAMHSGISRDLFNAASCWLGRLPGGLAISTVAGCAGFSAVSGDSMATAVTMASVALPEMKRKRYDQPFACATLACGGTLGILIPPSTGFIFYSLVTEASIGKLFMAGVIPGVLLALFFMAAVFIFSRRHPDLAPVGDPTTFRQKLRSLRGVLPMLALIFIILGGILGGLFSPNAGGAVGVVCVALYAFVTRKLRWSTFVAALRDSADVTGRLLYILIGVTLLGYFFAATRLPYELAEALAGMQTSRWVIFAGIVVFYILLGALLNVIPMVLLTLPAMYPSVLTLGFDPIWFGVQCVILMEMGQITPPVGINVFALSTMTRDVPMFQIFRHITPYFLCMLLLVVLLCFFPQLALWLPGGSM